MQYAYIGRKQRKETSVHYGFSVLTLVLENTECRIQLLWEQLLKKESL